MRSTRKDGLDANAAPHTRLRRVANAVVVASAVLFLVLAGGSTDSVCAVCHNALADEVGGVSGHEAVPCYACHLAQGAADWPAFKALELFVMYPRAAAGRTLSTASAPVVNGACLDCHDSILLGETESGGIRIFHGTCAMGRTCGGCHGADTHGEALRWPRQPVMEECVTCHKSEGVSTECDTCHSQRTEHERLAKGSWQVTHGANWSATHGMGTIEWCETCHPAGYCSKCHGVDLPHPADFGRTHGDLAQEPEAKCDSCHDATSLCDGCHGVPMPHPEGFLAQHSSQSSSFQDPRCVSCHIQDDCDACHEKHIHPGSTDGTARLPDPGEIGLGVGP